MAQYPGSSSRQDPPSASGSEAAPSSTDVPEVDSTPLDYGHLFDVQSELNEAATKWKSIGIALYLKPDFLQTIETRYSSDPRACLTWILMEWLMRKYNVEKFGEPTWQRLVEVVGHPAGGADMTLARTIARRHKAESRTDIAVAEEATREHKATGGAKKAKKITRRIKADCGADISVAEEITRKHKTAAGAIKARKIARRHNAEEDCSEPNFQLTASLMKEMDPVTLNIKQADKVTLQAVQLFAKKVVMILHTCNKNEYWAALERLEPPTTDNQSNIQDRPITYPQVGSVIGWFAGYRAAVVRTGQGNKCRDELTNALTKSFPHGRVIIAAGIGYSNDQKRKFADVLISDQIENFVQYKKKGTKITNHGPREEVDPSVQRVFENPARDWTDMQCFTCADNDRTSVAHIGCIVSAPTLVRDEVLRDQLMKHTPNAIGGEMEGWVLLELKRTLKRQHNKDIEVIVIKGVADYGDLKKGDKWQWTAAKAAMDCIHYCLSKSGGTEFSGISLTAIGDVPVATVDPLPSTPTLPPDPPDCVERYAQYLKDKYKRMPTLPEGDWPPSLGRQYTRLAMIKRERELPGAELVATMERDYIRGNIDNIVKRKKAIQLPEVFLPTEDGEQQLKILMDGAPGVGKSTLSRKMCKDWASGELLQQYHLVILLPLRQASIREARSVENLIYADDPDLKQQVVQHIQRTSGERILLIVDGYDELSYKDRTQSSLFLDIIQGNKFPRCSVLVTSRPYASDYLQRLESVNRHVEVLGFTEEQIEQCIMDNIPEKAKATELVETLKERQDIVSLCYIPLNCAIVVYVYKIAECTLPHTLTNLYEIFTLNAIKRHASITGNESFQMQFSTLSKLAYDGLVEDKMVFSTKDIKSAFPDGIDVDTDINLLGLVTVFKEFTSTGEELSYQFLHLTIQEFLAARWAASQLSDGELLKFFQNHLWKERYKLVLLFLAGISQLNFQSAEKLFVDNSRMKEYKIMDFLQEAEFFQSVIFLSHLIYESHSFSLFHNLGSTIAGRKLSAKRRSMSPFNCLVLAHFLSWGDCSLKLLDLSNCGLTSQSLEIMHRVNLEHCGTTQIEEVNLSHNPKITKLSLLSTLPMFEHTQVFKAYGLHYPEGVSPDQVELHCLLNMKHLTTLEISVEEFPDARMAGSSISLTKFIDALQKTTKLQVLQFEGNVNSLNAVDIFSLLHHNTSLQELDLSNNSHLAEGDSEAVGCAIEKLLNVNTTLRRLNLSGCNLTDPIVKRVLIGLTKNTSLVTLDVSSPKLSGSCAVSLFQQMTTYPTVRITVGEVGVLGVGRVKMDRGTMWCVIGDLIRENCVEFFRALNNSAIKVSNLNVQDLTDQTAEHFAIGLAEIPSVQALKLKHCNISSAGVVSIFRSLEHNISLEELDLSENRQLAKGDSEAVGCAIERMLNVNRTLKILNLNRCGIDTAVASHIATGLAHNASLAELNIGENYLITGEGWLHVFKALNNNKSVRKLDISSYNSVELNRNDNLEMEGLVALAEMLSCNKSLSELNLGRCHIPKAGLTKIARGLLQNTTLQTLKLWPLQHLEAEMERLKRSENLKPQGSSKLEIEAGW